MKIKSFLFDKLVRDKVLKKFEDEGITVHSKVLKKDAEFLEAVTQKIVEELDEVFQSETKEELIKELADFEEIFDIFKKLIKVTPEEIQAAKEAKLKDRGGFEKRIYVEYAEIPKSSKWYKYCEERPTKYPEIIEGEEEDDEEFDLFDDEDDND
ncbi:hypothetical protein EBU24_05700 [bacterium]|nr:hypothetical protein [bacterium]